MQRGACGKHRDTLLPNAQMLEEKLHGKAEVREPIFFFSNKNHYFLANKFDVIYRETLFDIDKY